MTLILDIETLFKNTLGYNWHIPWDGVQLEKYIPLLRLNAEGKIFEMPVKIKANESDEWLELPNALISIDGSKSIIKTPIDGNDGTFKENFAMNDYVINIRGIITDETNADEYPSEAVYALQNIWKEGKSVIILNELCTIFGIDYMCCEGISIPSPEGAQSYQPFILSGCSDRNFELIVTRKNG